MQSITYTIEIRWNVKGFESYGFGADNCLYNFKTGKKLRQSYNSGSIGYWFGKEFITLAKLKTLLIKSKKEYCPF